MENLLNHHIQNNANGSKVFNLIKFEKYSFSGKIQRNNYFSIIWVKEGNGKVKVGFSEFDFEDNSIFTFVPNQPYLFTTENPLNGIVINFHSEFVFVHHQKEENTLREILYNNTNLTPFIQIDLNSISEFDLLCEKIGREIKETSHAQHDLLLAYLRIFLINTFRIKMEQQPECVSIVNNNKEHYMLQKLSNFIEENFKAKHSPSDYADMLYVTPKTLGKISKSYYNKTISSIINERIVIEAKKELYLTTKAIKEIANELGYEDEYYFSRFFKNNTQVSPQKYRETVAYSRV